MIDLHQIVHPQDRSAWTLRLIAYILLVLLASLGVQVLSLLLR